MSHSLALFDFDKTLVRCDSFRLFGRMAAQSLWQRGCLLALALAFKAGRLTNGQYKARVIQRVWGPKPPEQREAHLRRFYDALHPYEQPNVVRALREHLEQDDAVTILSASPRFYLAPFVSEAWPGDIAVHGSEVRVEEGRATVDALYGEKKRALAQQLIRKHAPNAVWVYTDHVSDVPLLEVADHRRLVNPSRALRRAAETRGLNYQVIES